MSHGVMTAKKSNDANATPVNDDLPRRPRRYHAHSPDAGRKASSTGLFNAAIPQSAPNSAQGLKPSRSSMPSDSQKITAISSADRLVSHTQRVHQYMT